MLVPPAFPSMGISIYTVEPPKDKSRLSPLSPSFPKSWPILRISGIQPGPGYPVLHLFPAMWAKSEPFTPQNRNTCVSITWVVVYPASGDYRASIVYVMYECRCMAPACAAEKPFSRGLPIILKGYALRC